MIFALIGNQNCGKTTLFNQLTGANQHVGNFPVTVDQKKQERSKSIRIVPWSICRESIRLSSIRAPGDRNERLAITKVGCNY